MREIYSLSDVGLFQICQSTLILTQMKSISSLELELELDEELELDLELELLDFDFDFDSELEESDSELEELLLLPLRLRKFSNRVPLERSSNTSSIEGQVPLVFKMTTS